MTLHAVVSGWLLGAPSGANRRLLALLAELGPRLAGDGDLGERITVLHRPDFAPPQLPRIDWRSVDIPAHSSLRRAMAERRLLPGLLRELAASVYDHAFLPLPKVSVPTCLTIHDLRDVDGFGRHPRFVARAVLRSACRRADAIVVPSNYTKERLHEVVPDAPAATVVQNGVTVRHIDVDAQPVRGKPACGYLLHVGHLEPRKNVAVLVDALARIAAAERPELWLAGKDAGAWPEIEARARDRGVRSSVSWLGVVDDDELHRLYAHARAVVMPSRCEGFGLPVLEGLAHGRPVLASDAGALPEVLGGCGTPLPAGDAGAWAQAIVAVDARDPSAMAVRREHASGFSWASAAHRLLTIWRRLDRLDAESR